MKDKHYHGIRLHLTIHTYIMVVLRHRFWDTFSRGSPNSPRENVPQNLCHRTTIIYVCYVYFEVAQNYFLSQKKIPFE